MSREALDRERDELVARLDRWLETPMLVLGLLWLVLLVLELTRGLSPFLEAVGTAIWIVFIAEFALRFALAPHKLRYLRKQWLTALSLFVPALRAFRAFRALRFLRAARAARGVRLFRVVSSVNRGMRALGRSMGRRGFGYALALTALVTFAGAAGMYALEGAGLRSYGEALWWTAMIMTTLGSEYWPRTAEGRLLGFLLALYAFAVFGYVTATLSSFFLGRDAEDPEAELAGAAAVEALRQEIAGLRDEVRALARERGGV